MDSSSTVCALLQFNQQEAVESEILMLLFLIAFWINNDVALEKSIEFLNAKSKCFKKIEIFLK